jgi:hypothetical protein
MMSDDSYWGAGVPVGLLVPVLPDPIVPEPVVVPVVVPPIVPPAVPLMVPPAVPLVSVPVVPEPLVVSVEVPIEPEADPLPCVDLPPWLPLAEVLPDMPPLVVVPLVEVPLGVVWATAAVDISIADAAIVKSLRMLFSCIFL